MYVCIFFWQVFLLLSAIFCGKIVLFLYQLLQVCRLPHCLRHHSAQGSTEVPLCCRWTAGSGALMLFLLGSLQVRFGWSGALTCSRTGRLYLILLVFVLVVSLLPLG